MSVPDAHRTLNRVVPLLTKRQAEIDELTRQRDAALRELRRQTAATNKELALRARITPQMVGRIVGPKTKGNGAA